MRCGVVVSTGGAAVFADLAVAAERAGWDAVFSYEVPWGQDAWVTLTAAAMRTSTIRLGTMLTPLPRVRPWELAARAATLDDLSGGRVQLAVGMGALHEGWLAFEADEGRRTRAEKLDEGLSVYDGLMRGQPFSWSGKHYRVSPTTFLAPPPPVQRPRVPVWVVGAHPSTRSLGRAARWDGLLPARVGTADPLTPADLPDIVEAVRTARESAGLPWAGYDVVVEGTSEPGPAGDVVAAHWRTAGATWWVESDWAMGEDAVARHRRRIEAGPPRA
ncbi:LLM class flavin-dependent oxidoreductase [Nakamurella flavida]|uniref:LLM class flavin-dependent oxidoreductase n=1 Tax=Nakamurella flavida TaxID=363630 RepID=UPI001F052365|nr:LLM class flavin-dependent oxidoreductase [Nakamurella flavida]